MNLRGYEILEDLLYTKEHEWARRDGATIRVGITDYAAKTLNDAVYVTLPKLNGTVTQFKVMGTVESIKAVSELYSPISGTVVKVNGSLESHPELVNKSPYGEGWMVEVRATNLASEVKALLDSRAYASHLEATLHK